MNSYEAAQKIAKFMQDGMGADRIEAIEPDGDGDCYAIGWFGGDAVVVYVGVGPASELAIGGPR